MGKIRVHVEAQLKSTSRETHETISRSILRFLQTSFSCLSHGIYDLSSDEFLHENVEKMSVDTREIDGDNIVPMSDAEMCIHVYGLYDEVLTSDPTSEGEGEDDIVQYLEFSLPCTSLEGLWESLVMDHSLKRSLLEYVSSTVLFSAKGVNPHLISYNRLILLHGPPGTGKTSLCKGLAQRLSIRLGRTFPSAELLEINAQSLFTKMFGESGRNVVRLFSTIQDLVAKETRTLFFIIIDEVESLTASRQTSLDSSEPADAVRVVNAVLTQLDALRSYRNVFILATSNLIQGIDPAFLDRADVRLYIGFPNRQARYEILRSSLEELMRVEIITPTQEIAPVEEVKGMGQDPAWHDGTSYERKLWNLAHHAEGFSGRALRKLLLQAHANCIRSRESSLDTFLEGLEHIIQQRTADLDEASHESAKRLKVSSH